jgi:hypothetical protein
MLEMHRIGHLALPVKPRGTTSGKYAAEKYLTPINGSN